MCHSHLLSGLRSWFKPLIKDTEESAYFCADSWQTLPIGWAEESIEDTGEPL